MCSYTANLIRERDVNNLREVRGKQSIAYHKYHLSIFGGFLKWCGNNIVDRMQVEWPHDERINADWLLGDDPDILQAEAEGIERVIVHLELNLCMRRVELLRLRPCDFMRETVNVRGKGRQGGKWRSVPFDPDTREIIGWWMVERKRIIERAKAKNPGVVVPEALLIYEHHGHLGAYKKGAIDKFLNLFRLRLERKYQRPFEFNNHTLRRTGGRELWKAGVELETISKILGHEDTKTTIRYLGINHDDMSDAMQKVSQYRKNRRMYVERTIPAPASKSGGPNEIWTHDLPVISRALQPG